MTLDYDYTTMNGYLYPGVSFFVCQSPGAEIPAIRTAACATGGGCGRWPSAPTAMHRLGLVSRYTLCAYDRKWWGWQKLWTMPPKSSHNWVGTTANDRADATGPC